MANGRLQKQALLPPRSPFPAVTAAAPAPHAELGPIARPREPHHRHGHQRTSSESFLVDEQPSWLDDLLDEPETPARAHGRPGHRRSSSDSFTLFDGSASAGMYDNALDGRRGGGQVPSWIGAPEFSLTRAHLGGSRAGPGSPGPCTGRVVACRCLVERRMLAVTLHPAHLVIMSMALRPMGSIGKAMVTQLLTRERRVS